MDDRENTMASDEAGKHFAEIIERVSAGEEFTITEGGTPVARLVPIAKKTAVSSEERKATVEAILREAKGRSLGGLKIKDLINEGRR